MLAIFLLIGAFAKNVASSISLGLDLQGGFEIVYEVEPLNETEEVLDMSVVAQSVSKRVNVLGVSEPQILIEGEDRIRVQLAGVSDIDQARRIISSIAASFFPSSSTSPLADS